MAMTSRSAPSSTVSIFSRLSRVMSFVPGKSRRREAPVHRMSAQSKKTDRKSAERRRHITGITIIVVALLALLSIASYSTQDELILDKLSPRDIFRLPFDAQVRSLAA